MENVVIREIQKKDNAQVAKAIRQVLIDLGVPKVGTAYEDPVLDYMYEHYDKPKGSFFVAEKDGNILGCAGIAHLENYEGNVCELQKMYVLESVRGMGLGHQLIVVCLNQAKAFGFEGCYLETLPSMDAAQKLYKKMGFEYIDARMGDTGHYSCPVFMLKTL